jgi:hypothetical protein
MRQGVAVVTYVYSGDIDIESGGAWFDPSTWDKSCVHVVQVTNLDSSIGYVGAYLIESITVYLDKYPEQISVCGLSVNPDGSLDDNGVSRPIDDTYSRMLIAAAIVAYGAYDRDSEETLVIGRNADMSFNGWNADRRLRANVNLRKLIMTEYNITESTPCL